MWRDILIIAAFAIATLNYFGLGPTRILGYARTGKSEITKRKTYQRILLFFTIGLSGLIVYMFVIMFQKETPLAYFFFTTVLLYMMWDTTLHDVWKVSERVEKILDILRRFGALPLFIASLVLFEMPLWQKIVYPLGGFFIGFGIPKLKDYIVNRKRKRRDS